MARLAFVLAVAAVAAIVAATPRASSQGGLSQTLVRGRVVSSGAEPRPLPGARVVAVGGSDESTFTDGEGRFEVRVSSSASLRISKAGFAPIILRPTAAGSELHVSLSPGAVLTGLVVDELGFPVSDARVRARRVDPAGDGAAGAAELVADTDDLGEYRIGSLPAGRYAIHSERQLPRLPEPPPGLNIEMELKMLQISRNAPAKPMPMSDVVQVVVRPGEEVTTTLQHRTRAVSPPDEPIAGAVRGTVLDRFGGPAEGVTVRLWQVRYTGDRRMAYPAALPRRTDDRGHYRLFNVRPGQYVLAAADEELGFAPTYFPGTAIVANATPLIIRRREQLSGIDLVVATAREARVYGVALGADAGPFRGTLSLTATRRSGAIALPPKLARSDDAGVFEFLNVPPGEYVLRALRVEMPQHLSEFAIQQVRVDGPEVPPITIAASPTAALTGRVVLEGDSSGLSLASFSVATVPDADDGAVGVVTTGRSTDAGAFEMRGLAGVTRLASGTVPAGWWLKAVEIGGVNAAETPVRFAGRDDSRTDVTVVFSRNGGALTGRVRDDAGGDVDDYRVMAFSVNRERWFARSPYVRITGGPDADGMFTIRSLPPDDYWVVAVDGIDGDGDSGDWQNPDVLGSLVTAASRLSLGDATRAVVNLRLIRLR